MQRAAHKSSSAAKKHSTKTKSPSKPLRQQQHKKIATKTKPVAKPLTPLAASHVLQTRKITTSRLTSPQLRAKKSGLPQLAAAFQSNNTSRFALLFTPQRNLFIQTQTTPNPRSLKFHPGKVVLGEREDGSPNSVYFDQTSRANARRQCTLAYTLLLLDGVMNVMLGADFVTVTTIDDSTDWMLLKPMVYEAISEAYATDEPILKNTSELEPTRELAMLEGDEEAVSLIKEIIDLRIRPTVMDDGGDVEFIHFDKERVVWLLMKGSCSGCPSSGATLKHGIQNMIMHYVPEVKSVEEWKDEAQLVSDDVFKRLEEKLASKDKDEKH